MNAVDVQGVHVLRGGRPVLVDFSFTVGEHERVAVCGPNGVGKSTLLDLLLGLCPVRAGSVRVLGRKPPAAELGFVPQDPGASLLPWLSVRDNVVLPMRLAGADERSSERALREVCERLDPRATLELALRPDALSVGQRQLAALLRAMIARPRLLLCDEAFSALDAASRAHLCSVLAETTGGAQGPALVFVTHDAAEAQRMADRCVVLGAQGRQQQAWAS